MRKDKIIYSINIEDVQNVAEQEWDRELNNEELKIVVNNIGDYFGWYDSISNAIYNLFVLKEEKI